ncbi:MAG: hypothetical protein JSU92_10195 [Deltaproteobacteria bacterium]|nr:MAG: hypothetical protein JSU92_10195 [Deltaproteobacteria bacterium]
MKVRHSLQFPKISWFDAASGIFLMVFMASGYLYGMQEMPDISSADAVVAWYHSRGAMDAAIACVLVTIAFFFTFWFMGVVISLMRAAEGNGPLTWISLFGGLSFTTVFACALAFVLAPVC